MSAQEKALTKSEAAFIRRRNRSRFIWKILGILLALLLIVWLADRVSQLIAASSAESSRLVTKQPSKTTPEYLAQLGMVLPDPIPVNVLGQDTDTIGGTAYYVVEVQVGDKWPHIKVPVEKVVTVPGAERSTLVISTDPIGVYPHAWECHTHDTWWTYTDNCELVLSTSYAGDPRFSGRPDDQIAALLEDGVWQIRGAPGSFS